MEKEKEKYPIGAENYILYEEIGTEASALVHRALCNPLNEIVAIKILDFERGNCDLVIPLFSNLAKRFNAIFIVLLIQLVMYFKEFGMLLRIFQCKL